LSKCGVTHITSPSIAFASVDFPLPSITSDTPTPTSILYEITAKYRIDHQNISNYYTRLSPPCSGESQQQSPLRPEECSQPPPDRASHHPFAQQHPQSPRPDGGNTTRKISRALVAFKCSLRGGDTRRSSGLTSSLHCHRPVLMYGRSANIRSTARPLQQAPKCRLHAEGGQRRWHRTCRRTGMWRRHEAPNPRRP
jgi:hypothetical protein